MNTNFNSLVEKYKMTPEILSLFNVKHANEITAKFLAQGEYNTNFLVESPFLKAVLRLNTGSQMHLDNQIRYEYQTLKILESTGVTPKAYYCDDSKTISPYGMLVMEYIPGRWLEYPTDYLMAADIFAKIHLINYFPNSGLVVEAKPATGILEECRAMANVFHQSDLADFRIKKLITRATELIARRVEQFNEPFDVNQLVLNNTEVNSSNFLLNESTGEMKLVDWEKAIFSIPAQDLSHFLVPTTTFWKTNFRFSEEQIKKFMNRYCEQTGRPFSEINEQFEVFFPLTCLRGISWCAMAFVEYQQPDRELKNEFAFKKIQSFNKEDFIRDVFKTIL